MLLVYFLLNISPVSLGFFEVECIDIFLKFLICLDRFVIFSDLDDKT